MQRVFSFLCVRTTFKAVCDNLMNCARVPESDDTREIFEYTFQSSTQRWWHAHCCQMFYSVLFWAWMVWERKEGLGEGGGGHKHHS